MSSPEQNSIHLRIYQKKKLRKLVQPFDSSLFLYLPKMITTHREITSIQVTSSTSTNASSLEVNILLLIPVGEMVSPGMVVTSMAN